ncbi:MAG: protein kinase domain-containing protein, partial [Gemmataceae bacterium]
GPVAPERVIDYARQVARALAHAHAKGVVHRDIKPHNLLLDPSGVVKVLDVGLARFTDRPDDNLTCRLDEHAVVGTADYIAPEQAIHSAVDGRADLYSLGATLYALLAGSPPFGGKSLSQKLVAHQLRHARPLAEVCPSVPPALAAVVTRLMAKKPEDRFQTADELLIALGGTPAAPPAPPPRRWPALAAAAVLTVCAAAAGGWWVTASRPPSSEPHAEAPGRSAPEERPAPEPAVYRLDLTGHPAGHREGKKGGWLDLDGPVGKRWKGSVWNPDATYAFGVEEADGRPALSVRTVEGKSGGFLVLRDVPMKAGRRYAAEITFRLEDAGGSMLRVLHPGKKAVDLGRLRPGPGRWTAFTQVIEPEADGKVGLEFHLSAPTAGAALLLRDVVVRDAGPVSDPHPLRTFTWGEPFRVRMKHTAVIEKDGTVPHDVSVKGWAPDAVFEAERVDAGRPAVKLVMREGKPSGMLLLTAPPARPDRSYTLRVEYRTQGNPRAHVKVRHLNSSAEDVGRLDDSAGWGVATFAVGAGREGAVTVEVHQHGRTPEDVLWVGKTQWIEDGVSQR